MADYYSQFVAEIPYQTSEQLEWLKKEIADPDEIDKARREDNCLFDIWGGDPEDEWLLPNMDFEYDIRRRIVTVAGEANAHEIFFLVTVYAKKFDLFNDEPWSLEVSYACSKARADAFGGTGYCYYKGKAFYVSTNQAIEEWVANQ